MPDVRGSYDRLAAVYADKLLHELADKPLDRALLDSFADETRPRGLVLDIACGPGQVARYLHDRRVSVLGIDLSPQMIRIAHAAHPDLAFAVGDMTALPHPEGAFAGIVAFYAIVNLPPPDVVRAIAELARVLAPRAPLLVAFHIGAERVRPPDLWGVPVDLDFWLFEPAAIADQLAAAGLRVEARLEREPYPGVEHPTRRAYLLARKP